MKHITVHLQTGYRIQCCRHVAVVVHQAKIRLAEVLRILRYPLRNVVVGYQQLDLIYDISFREAQEEARDSKGTTISLEVANLCCEALKRLLHNTAENIDCSRRNS